jgi:hypothetical protein
LPLIHDLRALTPYSTWDFHIVLDADWDDELPQFMNSDDDPIDLTGSILHMWVRPHPDSTILLLDLTTSGGDIVIDSAADGLASMAVEKSQIQAAFAPSGSAQLYKPLEARWYLRWTDDTDREELARGRLFVHPGND